MTIDPRTGSRRIFFAIALLHFWLPGSAQTTVALAGSTDAVPQRVRIALIIDDLGDAAAIGRRAASLDGPVACAVLPHTPFGKTIAEQAHAAGKEVLLHLPLQPVEEILIGSAGTIGLDDSRAQLMRIFDSDMNSVPHAVGVNNHMGSLLTRHPGHMQWLMDAVKARGGLFFVDSYTTAASVALRIAQEQGVPAIRRDVFLDVDPHPAEIAREFRRLIGKARTNGFAVGIGHPLPETLQYLEQTLPGLSEQGVDLVSVRSLISEPGTSIVQ